jgi:hypothetical protein
MSRKTISSFEALMMSAVIFGLTIVYYNLNKKNNVRHEQLQYIEAQVDTLEMRLSSLEEIIHDMNNKTE